MSSLTGLVKVIRADFPRIDRYADGNLTDECNGMAPSSLQSAKQTSVHGMYRSVRSFAAARAHLPFPPSEPGQVSISHDPAPEGPVSSFGIESQASTYKLSSPPASTQNGRSPHVATGEFSSPVSNSGAMGASIAGADGTPEQKIFPGIVHERARRGSIRGQSWEDHSH